jgi:hypothetical protein
MKQKENKMGEGKDKRSLNQIEKALLVKANKRIKEELHLAVQNVLKVFTNNKIPLDSNEHTELYALVHRAHDSEKTQGIIKRNEVADLLDKLENIEDLIADTVSDQIHDQSNY